MTMWASTEVMLTMALVESSPRAAAPFSSSGRADWLTRNGPVEFTAKTWSHSATLTSSKLLPLTIPALLTRVSSRPNFASISAMPLRTEASSATSITTGTISGCWPIRRSSAASSRSRATTVAPSLRSFSAMARPFPDAAPVTAEIFQGRVVIGCFFLSI